MNRRVLLIGATGVFGERLAQHLCPIGGIDLFVTSRDEHKAKHLAARLLRAHPYASVSAIQLDHRHNLQARLEAVKPFIVVDCSGPFQHADYSVATAVLQAGAHIIDLADARDYLKGYADELDAVARQNGRTGLAGASSTPALSACVARVLTRNWQRVDTIDICITPGGQSEVGRSVLEAIMTYAGRNIPVWNEGKLGETIGWAGSRIVTMPELGERRVAPVETLDPELLGPRHAVTSRVRFAAGLESRIEQWGMQVIAGLRRARVLRGAGFLVPLLLSVRRLTRLTTSDSGGMSVSISGIDASGRYTQTCWSLLAKDGHGPFVPVLPAAAAVKALVRGNVEPGARLAERGLSLSDIETEMASYPIETRTEPTFPDKTIFEEQLGQPVFAAMPAVLQSFHGLAGAPVWSGQADVQAASWFLPRLLAKLFGFPASGSEIPVTVAVERKTGADGISSENWSRNFAGQHFSSTLQLHRDGTLLETFGPFSFEIAVTADHDRLIMPVTGWRLWNIPLPGFLAPRSQAREYQDEQGRFCFDVELTLPLIGLFAHYKGWLLPQEPVS